MRKYDSVKLAASVSRVWTLDGLKASVTVTPSTDLPFRNLVHRKLIPARAEFNYDSLALYLCEEFKAILNRLGGGASPRVPQFDHIYFLPLSENVSPSRNLIAPDVAIPMRVTFRGKKDPQKFLGDVYAEMLVRVNLGGWPVDLPVIIG